jgi:peptidoglycan L-alanyl-D-glutamate endopeptidase CwlK
VTSLAEAGSRTLRAIDTLDVGFQKQVRGWVNEMVTSRIEPLIYCGRRTMEEQAALYAKGRTSKGKIVTKARPGESYHNYGLAFDWVPLKRTAKNADLWVANWDDETAFKLGEHVGLSFGLVGISWETGHLQTSLFKSWRDIPREGVEQVRAKDIPQKSKATTLVSSRPWSSR